MQQSTQRDDSPHNSKSPGFSPKQSPPSSPNHAPRTMMRQHTAPASYGNSSLCKDIIHDTGHVNPVALASNNIGGGKSFVTACTLCVVRACVFVCVCLYVVCVLCCGVCVVCACTCYWPEEKHCGFGRYLMQPNETFQACPLATTCTG